MKSFHFVVLTVLAAFGTNAVPAPAADAELGGRTYISYGALGADRIPSNSGPATEANPYNRGCTVEDRCFRDTGKRSTGDNDDFEVEVMSTE